MKIILAASVALAMASPAAASCNTYGNTSNCYDYNTGSSYRTTRDSDGNSRTSGYNTQTGTTWSQRTNGSTGRTSGFDSKGGFWTCDRRGNCN